MSLDGDLTTIPSFNPETTPVSFLIQSGGYVYGAGFSGTKFDNIGQVTVFRITLDSNQNDALATTASFLAPGLTVLAPGNEGSILGYSGIAHEFGEPTDFFNKIFSL